MSAKLRLLDEESAVRRKVASMYLAGINNSKIQLPYWDRTENHVFHLFVVRVKDRGNFQEYLTSKGIQTVIHYPIPPHKQIAYEEWSGLSFPISESIHNEVISLPMTSVLSKDEITTVINVLNEY